MATETLVYGEFTPVASVKNDAGKDWPLSYPAQVCEVRPYLRELLAETGHDPESGVQVLVKWNGLRPTMARLFVKDYGDGVLRECFAEFDPATGEPIGERQWSEIQEHIKDLHMRFAIRPFDRAPGAPRHEV